VCISKYSICSTLINQFELACLSYDTTTRVNGTCLSSRSVRVESYWLNTVLTSSGVSVRRSPFPTSEDWRQTRWRQNYANFELDGTWVFRRMSAGKRSSQRHWALVINRKHNACDGWLSVWLLNLKGVPGDASVSCRWVDMLKYVSYMISKNIQQITSAIIFSIIYTWMSKSPKIVSGVE